MHHAERKQIKKMEQDRDNEIDILFNIDHDEFNENIYPKILARGHLFCCQLLFPLATLRHPVILRGLDIGPCTVKWSSLEYLIKQGGDKSVKIHVSELSQMDFINKNFVYRSLPFDEFVSRAAVSSHSHYFLSPTEKYYLRALGDDPRKEIANIHTQFPTLAQDVKFPEFFPQDNFFSSVFRIASKGLQLWTHYDIMDNFLLQISGKKKVVLFHPEDANYLYLNGDKSEVLDIDNPDLQRFPEFHKARRYTCYLEPGDVLFIPALWFHNVISLDFGIAVNVFWKHLDDSFYDSRDTYGNKDLLPAARATQIMDRAIKTLEELPPYYRTFYAQQLMNRIERKIIKKPDNT